jgi:hypothetical protein
VSPAKDGKALTERQHFRGWAEMSTLLCYPPLPLQPQMVTGSVCEVLGDSWIAPVDEMITGQLSLPCHVFMPHRLERYAFQAGRHGFESRLPLQSLTKLPTLDSHTAPLDHDSTQEDSGSSPLLPTSLDAKTAAFVLRAQGKSRRSQPQLCKWYHLLGQVNVSR